MRELDDRIGMCGVVGAYQSNSTTRSLNMPDPKLLALGHGLASRRKLTRTFRSCRRQNLAATKLQRERLRHGRAAKMSVYLFLLAYGTLVLLCTATRIIRPSFIFVLALVHFIAAARASAACTLLTRCPNRFVVLALRDSPITTERICKTYFASVRRTFIVCSLLFPNDVCAYKELIT